MHHEFLRALEILRIHGLQLASEENSLWRKLGSHIRRHKPVSIPAEGKDIHGRNNTFWIILKRVGIAQNQNP